MYQIDVPSALAERPASTAQGVAGFFGDGDPVGGTAATILPAEFMNMLMLELLNIVVAGGVAPSKSDSTQVLQGIKNLFSGTLSGNGHISIPVGPLVLTLNWGGVTTTDGSGAQPIVFEKPFTTGVFASLASNAANGPPAAFHGTGAHSKTGMTVYSSTSSGVAAGAGTAVRWFAIGS